MKSEHTIIKCHSCGYEIMPFTSEMIKNAYLDKDNVAHFEFDCPKCATLLESTAEWKQ